MTLGSRDKGAAPSAAKRPATRAATAKGGGGGTAPVAAGGFRVREGFEDCPCKAWVDGKGVTQAVARQPPTQWGPITGRTKSGTSSNLFGVSLSRGNYELSMKNFLPGKPARIASFRREDDAGMVYDVLNLKKAADGDLVLRREHTNSKNLNWVTPELVERLGATPREDLVYAIREQYGCTNSSSSSSSSTAPPAATGSPADPSSVALRLCEAATARAALADGGLGVRAGFEDCPYKAWVDGKGVTRALARQAPTQGGQTKERRSSGPNGLLGVHEVRERQSCYVVQMKNFLPGGEYIARCTSQENAKRFYAALAIRRASDEGRALWPEETNSKNFDWVTPELVKGLVDKDKSREDLVYELKDRYGAEPPALKNGFHGVVKHASRGQNFSAELWGMVQPGQVEYLGNWPTARGAAVAVDVARIARDKWDGVRDRSERGWLNFSKEGYYKSKWARALVEKNEPFTVAEEMRTRAWMVRDKAKKKRAAPGGHA